MLIDSNITEYYRVNFQVVDILGISLTDLERMLPFERDIYIDLLTDKLKRENQQK